MGHLLEHQSEGWHTHIDALPCRQNTGIPVDSQAEIQTHALVKSRLNMSPQHYNLCIIIIIIIINL